MKSKKIKKTWKRTRKGIYKASWCNSFHYVLGSKPSKSFKTEEECIEAYEKALTKVPEKPGGGTFGWLIEQYTKQHLDKKAETTKKTIVSLMGKHVIPYIKHRKLLELKTSDFDDILMKANKKSSPKTSNKVLKKLNSLYNWALAREDTFGVNRNPVAYIQPLPVTPIERKALTEEQLIEFLNRISGQYKYMMALGGLAGARLGEVLGFWWTDFDFEKNTIKFVRQINSLNEISYRLKSNKSHATVKMMPSLSKMMKEWKLEKNDDSLWVFSNEYGDRVNRRIIEGDLRIIFNRYPEYGITHHNLRHTFATLAISKGMLPKRAQQHMRHATSRMTMDVYTHMVEKDSGKQIDEIDIEV